MIDASALTAIDVHVHIEVDDHGHGSLPPDLVDAMTKYFGAEPSRPGIDDVAAYYRERRMAAVVFTVEATTNLRHPAISSADVIARALAEHSDVLIPFGSVDPLGPDPVGAADALISAGARGFKFHPTAQGFSPDDRAHYPLYERIQAAGLPTIWHTGQTGAGAGTPGGYGMKLALSTPMLLDAVAADFPALQIVMAHPSVPWQDEAISVATHKANVWIDLSGWSPKYFPEQLVRQARTRLQDKVLFGSDFPVLTPDRWMKDFALLEFPDDVTAKILLANARRLLAL